MSSHQQFESGKLIYLIGASGSGKDSLLRALTHQHLSGIVIARRSITRETRAGCEGHIPMGEAEFNTCSRAGNFLFHWQAYGFHYGIGREILLDLNEGRHVIINGSRRYLVTAQEIYPELIPVCLEVDPAILKLRLQQRGRETPREISARLDRAAKLSSLTPGNVIRLGNNGEMGATTEQFLKVLARY
jgi:ribose 1,5-bisphosphokinase